MDLSFFREERGGDPEKIRESTRRRFGNPKIVDEIILADQEMRTLIQNVEDFKNKKNVGSKKVKEMKRLKENEKMAQEIKEIKKLNIELEDKEKCLCEKKKELEKLLSKVGCIVSDDVPISLNEKDNVLVREWIPEGEKLRSKKEDVKLFSHHELLEMIGGVDTEIGAKVAGHRGYYLKGLAVMLNQALINYGLNFLYQLGYEVSQTPYFLTKEVMEKVAQLSDFEETLYRISGNEDQDSFLIATSEQALVAYCMDSTFSEKDVPKKYCGFSSCFRKEAGKRGKEMWGIFRVHQFEKVEQFVVCSPDDDQSKRIHDQMVQVSQDFYKSLKIPFRVMMMVSSELNLATSKKYDLEAWFPGYDEYKELVSCSNCLDYQARKINCRYGFGKQNLEQKKKYVHMLNGTLVATERAICCILENYQTKDGIVVPEKLVPYMSGISFIPFVKSSEDVLRKIELKKPKIIKTKK